MSTPMSADRLAELKELHGEGFDLTHAQQGELFAEVTRLRALLATIPDEELKGMLAYCEKSSKGEWEVVLCTDGNSEWREIHAPNPPGINPKIPYVVADTLNRHHCIAEDEDHANAQFMGRAHTDLPRVVRELIGYREEHKGQ